VGAFFKKMYKLVFSAMVIYISKGINKSNKAKESVESILKKNINFRLSMMSRIKQLKLNVF